MSPKARKLTQEMVDKIEEIYPTLQGNRRSRAVAIYEILNGQISVMYIEKMLISKEDIPRKLSKLTEELTDEIHSAYKEIDAPTMNQKVNILVKQFNLSSATIRLAIKNREGDYKKGFFNPKDSFI